MDEERQSASYLKSFELSLVKSCGFLTRKKTRKNWPTNNNTRKIIKTRTKAEAHV